MEAFSLCPQDSSNNSPNCLLFCLSANFLLNKTSFFIDILQIIDRCLRQQLTQKGKELI